MKRTNTEQALWDRLAEPRHGELHVAAGELEEVLTICDTLRRHLDETTGIALQLRSRLNELGDDPDEITTWGVLSRDKTAPYRGTT